LIRHINVENGSLVFQSERDLIESFEFMDNNDFENGDCNIMLEQNGNWWTNGYYGLSLEVNEEIDSMTADIGNLVEPLLLERDPNGEYLLISNFTSTNQIIEIYKKSN